MEFEEFSYEEEEYLDVSDYDEEDEEPYTTGNEGEIVDASGQYINVEDWIRVKDIRLGVDMTGFVLRIEHGYVYAYIIETNQISYIPIHRVSVQVIPFTYTLETLDMLIDLSLQLKVKEWFIEWTNIKNALLRKKNG